EWLCRNCNSLNADEAPSCVYCHADRPDECPQHDPSQPAGTPALSADDAATVIHRESYANSVTPTAPKYTFRESVLVTAADIILIIGLFCSFGALIAPALIDGDVPNLRLYSIVGAIVLFAWGMISWALLRCVADISRRLRRDDE
ncbi:MAG: hypothetical protein K2O07_01220, partial [Alistipes sp.]|nr:hypothetical protein [Alistipes sp.]